MKSRFHGIGIARRPRQAGWTLIEFIGVLAIGALLLGLVAPVLQQALEDEAHEVEQAKLHSLGSGLRAVIALNGQIPSPTEVFGLVAPHLGWREQAAGTNSRGNGRVVLVDPNHRVGSNTNQALPYFQSAIGSVAPQRVRLLLVSSMGEPLPRGLTNGALDEVGFQELWNLEAGRNPRGWMWDGQGTDLLLERVDLTEALVPVSWSVLADVRPRISVGTNASYSLAQGFLNGWYLRGTWVHLEDASGQRQVSERLVAPASFRFEAGNWRRTGSWNGLSESPSGADFAARSQRLLALPVPAGGSSNAPGRLLSAMTNFTGAYERWVTAGQALPPPAGSEPETAWQELRQAANALVTSP